MDGQEFINLADVDNFIMPGTESYQMGEQSLMNCAGPNTMVTQAQVHNEEMASLQSVPPLTSSSTAGMPFPAEGRNDPGPQLSTIDTAMPYPEDLRTECVLGKRRADDSGSTFPTKKECKFTALDEEEPHVICENMRTETAGLWIEEEQYELPIDQRRCGIEDNNTQVKRMCVSLQPYIKPVKCYSTPSQSGGGGVNFLDSPPGSNSQSKTGGGEAEIGENEGEPGGGEESEAEEDGVYIERVRTWERPYHRYRSLTISEEFRFINLDRVTSFPEAIAAIQRGVQEILNDVRFRIDEGDAVQLQLDGGGMTTPFCSFKKRCGQLNASDFLDSVVAVLQSSREIFTSESLRLVVTSITPPSGGGPRRTLKSIPHSAIITKKRRFLIDMKHLHSHLCFAGGLLGVMRRKEHLTNSQLLEAAEQLHKELGWSDQRKVGLDDISRFENHLNINIQVFGFFDNGYSFFKTGDLKYEDTYFMFLHDDHYYGVTDIRGFIGSRNYCSHCASLYNHKHDCSKICWMCSSAQCKKEGSIKCPKCHRYCNSELCLERHRELAGKKEIECPSRTWCKKCCSYNPKRHDIYKCKGKRCRVCGGKLGLGKLNSKDFHQCYLEPLKDPPVSEHYIFYDFECTQETGEHVPNYLFAKASNSDPKWKLSGKSWVFKGENCARDFILKITKDVGFKNSTFIAHNAKAYDSYFIVKQLILQKLCPELVVTEGKLMCVDLKTSRIKFIDSLNHLPMALAKLPKAFGFEGCKGYFPHFFNTKENQDYVGPLPKAHYYGVDMMMPSDREVFLKWHEENKNTVFDLQKELAYYCQQDVNILEQACHMYREEITKLTEQNGKCIDPFQYITLAGACFAMYRFNFLSPRILAIPPPDHYHRQIKRFSSASIQWLEYIRHTENISIQHALKGGEKKVGNYFLDGYAVVEGQKTAFEFNGCYWHGCSQCYHHDEVNKMAGKPFLSLFNETHKKDDTLKKWGFEVRSIWEHEWNHLKKTDESVKDFLAQMKYPEPLVPRDALFGGRTDAITLYYKTSPEEQIHYYDFTSLYPFVNKVNDYPVGHPTIITENFRPLSEYFGFAQVKLYTPRGLFFPVLPCKIDGKLVFTLCRTCAQNKQQEPCAHSEDERALSGTWCTVEIALALSKGYKVAHITEVWHFEKKSDQMFAEYIKMHLRQKQEASGYPAWCKTEEDKIRYVEEYFKKEGVRLRQSHIAPNPSRRQVAKLFLNSLWGKFAQRTNLPNNEIVRHPGRFLELIFSDKYEPVSCSFIDDEAACVSWKYTKERMIPAKHTNVYVACFTTAYARLKLYSVLDGLGERCLYHDTDSVIFTSRPGDWNPPLGDYLGELTSELPPGQHITEFVSAGPKSYGYRLAGGETCVKVKGITLNSVNSEKINFGSLKDLVFTYISGDGSGEISLNHPGIVRDKKTFSIKTKTLTKTQKVLYDKRVLVDGFKSLPYGY